MSDTEEEEVPVGAVIEEKYENISLDSHDEEITTNIQSGKKKKPRTEKQLLALEKARETRKKNAERKKLMELKNAELEEENKQYLRELHNAKSNPKPIIKPKKVKKQPKIIYEDESSDEEEVVVVKRRKPKKQKKIIYKEESSSESEDDDDYNNLVNPQKKSVSYSNDDEVQYHYQYQQPLKYADLINYG